MQAPDRQSTTAAGMSLRVRGLVQGVGFRPTVWRIARECGLHGEVRNDGAGVLIQAFGEHRQLERFVERITSEAPPLARIDAIERAPLVFAAACPVSQTALEPFRIVASAGGTPQTAVVPDAAACAACVEETFDRAARRRGYAFTNCTHCGPRFSIVREIPFDRCNTTMDAFELCDACRDEYENPADRRFHAQALACPECGPGLRFEERDRNGAEGVAGGTRESRTTAREPIREAARTLAAGAIVAIKGVGGYHLACDATNADAVERLRDRKRRARKPFALMAKDLASIERYCHVSTTERQVLESAAAPIVLLERRSDALPEALAPGARTFGFMLPYTPLHHLLMRAVDRPLVMTSGNLSDEPQCITDDDAKCRLTSVADAWITHDREIANRIDDSVMRVMDGTARMLRRARGFAPAPIALPAGFENARCVLAMGGMLKNTFCLLKDGHALLSQHGGDLDHPLAYLDYRKNLDLYCGMFGHTPELIAVDCHPAYPSTRLGAERAARDGLALIAVQHHHAHLASCLAEHGVRLETEPVLGVTLDGLGMGEQDELWGGEFLLGDYRSFRRVARFKPVALLGGERAMAEPWRNTYAHLAAALGWEACQKQHGELELLHYLQAKPLATFDAMLARGVNAPLASSCGRLFDAVAAAVGVCREQTSYEGEAAVALEALLQAEDAQRVTPYPFALVEDAYMMVIDPAPMWRALLGDLAAQVPPRTISARFHAGLAQTIGAMAQRIASAESISKVALTGGVFHNRTLLVRVSADLRARGLQVLTHARVPAGDGGLALGQAAVAAARSVGSMPARRERLAARLSVTVPALES